MTTATRTKTAKRRSATVTKAGVLTLREEGRPETSFWLTRLRADFGLAFELKKFVAEGGEVYHVNLSPADGRHSCECKGWLKWNRCRHVAALTALIASG